MLAAGHVGLLILVAIAYDSGNAPAPEIIRAPIDWPTRGFVLAFAIAPLLLSAALAFSANGPHAYVAAPLVLLSRRAQGRTCLSTGS